MEKCQKKRPVKQESKLVGAVVDVV